MRVCVGVCGAVDEAAIAEKEGICHVAMSGGVTDEIQPLVRGE